MTIYRIHFIFEMSSRKNHDDISNTFRLRYVVKKKLWRYIEYILLSFSRQEKITTMYRIHFVFEMSSRKNHDNISNTFRLRYVVKTSNRGYCTGVVGAAQTHSMHFAVCFNCMTRSNSSSVMRISWDDKLGNRHWRNVMETFRHCVHIFAI